MCGIVGYVGQKQATPIIMEGLRRLEYRGYDSAGLAVIQDGKLALQRAVGRISALEKMLDESDDVAKFMVDIIDRAVREHPQKSGRH